VTLRDRIRTEELIDCLRVVSVDEVVSRGRLGKAQTCGT